MNVGRAIQDRKQEVGSWTCTGSWSQRVRCFFLGKLGWGGGVTLLFFGGGGMREEEVELYYTILLKKLTKTSEIPELFRTLHSYAIFSQS